MAAWILLSLAVASITLSLGANSRSVSHNIMHSLSLCHKGCLRRSYATADRAQGVRLPLSGRGLLQLVEPMGAGKAFGTLQGGISGSTFGTMAHSAGSASNSDDNSGDSAAGPASSRCSFPYLCCLGHIADDVK